MLSKISVKKPYTVLVGVVIVLVLGFMSLRDMSTDLLPDMDLPYAIVITTYGGASPEEVESAVTKPVEQSMAGVTNVKEVSSISNSNYSMVVLEFNEGSDMNAATIDMRESLDAVSAMWTDDAIGSPTIMKLNPDMMPIMVAAVDYDDLDANALAEKLETDILPEIESVEGIASVSTSGEVEEKIDVILQEKKIEEVNERVQAAISGQFADAEDELAKNEDKLESGKDKLTQSQEDTAEKLAEGAAELDKNGQKIASTLITINSSLAELETKETTLQESLTQVKSGLAQVATGKAQLQATIATLQKTKEGLEQVQSGLTTLRQQETDIKAQMAAGADNGMLSIQLAAIQTQIQAITDQLTAQSVTEAELPTKIAEVSSGITQAQTALTELKTQEKTLQENQKEILAGQKKIAAGKKQLIATKAQLEAGQISIESAKKELDKQTVMAAIQLSVASVEVNNGVTQITDAKGTLKDKKNEALENADMTGILTDSLVEGILTAQNFEMPAGYVTEDETSYLVKIGEELGSQEELEDLVIMDMGIDGLDPIRLSDVADVAVTDNADDSYTVVNGNAAIALTIEKATGYSTGDVSDRLNERFEKLQKEMKGLHMTVLMDQGIYIDMVVDSVVENLLVGALLAVVILFLFLKDIRPTLIVACSIPLSVVAAVVLMYFSGVSLNVISLSGLALGVGMLVDNSVVVIENIFRMRNEEGASVRKAAIEGARQVTGAIIASTLTTVCVFAPIVFTEGITKQIFVDLALTLAYSLLASLVVSLTLVPAMAQGLLRRDKVRKEGLFNKLQNAYAFLLEKVLHMKTVVLLASLALLIVFMVLAFTRGMTFMPEMGSTQMTATVSVPDDVEMSDQELYEHTDEIMDQMLEVKGVETVGAMSGGSGTMSMMSGGGNGISVYILLDENGEIDNAAIKAEMEKRCKDIPVELAIETSAMDMSSMMGSGLTLQVKGKDLDKLQKITEDFMERIQDVEGIDLITNGLEDSEKEVRVTVDKEKAMEYSLTVAQVFQQIYDKLAEAKNATTLSTDTDDLKVYVSKEEDTSMSRKDLEKMKITYTDNSTQKTKSVKLSKIADFTMVDSPKSINRVSQTRYMTVSITLKEGYNATLVGEDVNKALKGYEMPSGYTYESTGEDETTSEAMGQVYLLLFVGVLFMYLIMVAQFQSLLSPFIILFTIPLAFTGGFMGLYISGSEVSVIAMIGFVMLAGIIVNNGIVLVDYINQLRISGVEKYEAIVAAGRIRLRPILMTAITTILGLIPMLVTNDSGSDMMKPMSIVTVGGLIYGTLLTLFVVPCIYAILNRKSDAKMVESQLDE